MTPELAKLQQRLWEAADQLRANSGLRSSEYSTPVLGLIFLRYADELFADAHVELEGKGSSRRRIAPSDYHARGVLYLPEESRFDYLMELPEGADLGKALNDAMKGIEANNPDLAGVLPRAYGDLPNSVLIELLRLLRRLPELIEGDGFGLIYEYFLGQFAFSEGQKGGEFFTPTSIVKLIVEIIEPYHGKIYDPACGSGGMFVQSAHFVERHRHEPSQELSIYGQEKTKETVRLAKMNLAVHGMAGDIREANSYYDDLHSAVGAFDFVMANPPFNVNKVDKSKLEDDKRYPFGLPKADNANYLWIQQFYSALNFTGRAGFVMSNSATDARGSELEIRRRLIESDAVEAVIAVGSNFFLTVTLPVTLWFLNRAKRENRADQILFIDAKHVFTQIDRAHRAWSPHQIEFLSNIVHLWRGVPTNLSQEAADDFGKLFPDESYRDIPGLCASVPTTELAKLGYSLSPPPHVGSNPHVAGVTDEFVTEVRAIAEDLELLVAQASGLTEEVETRLARLLETLEGEGDA